MVLVFQGQVNFILENQPQNCETAKTNEVFVDSGEKASDHPKQTNQTRNYVNYVASTLIVQNILKFFELKEVI